MHTRWLRAGVLAMLACAAFSAPAQVADHGHGPAPRPEHFDARTAHFDARFDHGHYYPPRGVYVHQLPPAPVLINHPSGRFYYSGGVWYAPRGPRFVVVPAPVGVFVPVLPAYYTTIWYGGVPYYYANDTYYNWSPDQNSYEVVQPPADVEQQATTQPPPSDELFVYPQRGQSESSSQPTSTSATSGLPARADSTPRSPAAVWPPISRAACAPSISAPCRRAWRAAATACAERAPAVSAACDRKRSACAPLASCPTPRPRSGQPRSARAPAVSKSPLRAWWSPGTA